MQLNVNSHGIELSDRLREYVEKKTDRIDRYMPTVREVRVELSEHNARNVNERQVAQITVHDKHGTILRAEERSSDLFAAIDTVMDKIHRQITRYRGKMLSRRRNAVSADEFAMAEPVPGAAPAEEEEPLIVRRKQFSLMPMSIEEAGDQMELLGHDFFVFFNREVDAVNVLYKRRDGNYGLLQPEIG